MDDHISFHLRAESVDGLHMLLGFLDDRFPYLIRCIQLFYKLVVREYSIMNDVTARSDVLAIWIKVLFAWHMPSSYDFGVFIAIAVYRAGDNYLIHRLPPIFKAVGFGDQMSLVHGYQLLIQPNDVGQHRVFYHLARDLVYLHPPHVGGSAGYG